MHPFRLEQAADAADAIRATSVSVDADREAPSAHYLAGGTQLLDLMKLGVIAPGRLVDVNGFSAQYRTVEVDETGVSLGSLARMADVADHPAIRRDYPMLAESLWKAASPQLRNMASLAGNLLQRTRCPYFRDVSWRECNKRNPGSGCAAISGVNRRLAVLGVSDHCIANYPGDFAIALAALGAEIDVLSPEGAVRRIAAEALHRLPGETPHLETHLKHGDFITGFHIPAAAYTRRSLYMKVRDRTSYDFALASAAVALDIDDHGRIRDVRIGLGGLVAKPWRAREAEDAIRGRVLDEQCASAAAEAAFAEAVTHGDNAFKPELGRRTLVRALLEARSMELPS